jgi:hypothetical protein
MTIKLLLLMNIFLVVSAYSAGITFTFANPVITGTSPKFYEFDVMVAAAVSGTKIGDTQTYINYNPDGYGENINVNGKVTAEKIGLINSPYYSLQINDNDTSRLSVTSQYALPGDPSFASDLPTTPTQLLHIIIEISNESENAGLSFEEDLMKDNQFESNNSTKYSPVVATDLDDSPLPVTLISFRALSFKDYISIVWVTQSEINNAGFDIYRSNAKEQDFVLLTSYLNNPDLEGQGNSNAKHEYKFIDRDIESSKSYWYKLVDIDISGNRTFHGPVSALVNLAPSIFKLYANYPNPFNPYTTLKYDIPNSIKSDIDVSLKVFNNLGQLIKTLVGKKMGPGSYAVLWDGKTDKGVAVSSGVYFAVLKAGAYYQSSRMILLK